MHTEMAKSQMKAMADHIFETLASACPHLVALVIEATREDGSKLVCGGFVRTKQINILGRTSYVGFPLLRKRSSVIYFAQKILVIMKRRI
jgi:hypothetical protein